MTTKIPSILDKEFENYNPYSILKEEEINKFVNKFVNNNADKLLKRSIAEMLSTSAGVLFLPEKINKLYDSILLWSQKFKEKELMRGFIKYASKNPTKYEQAISCMLLTFGFTSFISSYQTLQGNQDYIKLDDFKYLFKGIIKGIEKGSFTEGVLEFGKREEDEFNKKTSHFPRNLSSSIIVYLYHLDYFNIVKFEKMSFLTESEFPWYKETKTSVSDEIEKILNYTFPSHLEMFGGEKLRYIYRDFDNYRDFFFDEFREIKPLYDSLNTFSKYAKHLYWGVFSDYQVIDREKYYNKP